MENLARRGIDHVAGDRRGVEVIDELGGAAGGVAGVGLVVQLPDHLAGAVG